MARIFIRNKTLRRFDMHIAKFSSKPKENSMFRLIGAVVCFMFAVLPSASAETTRFITDQGAHVTKWQAKGTDFSYLKQPNGMWQRLSTGKVKPGRTDSAKNIKTKDHSYGVVVSISGGPNMATEKKIKKAWKANNTSFFLERSFSNKKLVQQKFRASGAHVSSTNELLPSK